MMTAINSKNTTMNLDTNAALRLSTQEMAQILKCRSYPVNNNGFIISISKRELQCLFEMMKGKHLGEISQVLEIKKSSVETYICNLKNKLGASTKSELFGIVIKHNLIEQISL